MKKLAFILVVFFITSSLWAQKKYALVIGNQTYTNITPLKNPVNDANDMADTLQTLGFEVKRVLDGNLEEMKKAVTDFSNCLRGSRNSYGFFFYAGHGVQSNGENYLIPVNANIPSEAQLEYAALSLGLVMAVLTEAENELNLIVLDACRNNPFSFNRSGSRGLSVVSHAPPGSITMYATSAGAVAQDGDGRNGIFTSHLLNNLKLPDLEVEDVFKRTMRDVENATSNRQRPAIYTQFSGLAYLGSRPPQNKETYLIGERGPAGGIIFYDKGNSSDGWRYLEAAPVSQEFKNIEWGAYRIDVSGTQTDIGSGKKNTDLIIKFLKDNNEHGRAAQLCAQLSWGGFTDWFLPSLDELKWMYENLAKQRIGDFSGQRYWSSSQYNKYYAWYLHFGDNGRPSRNYNKDQYSDFNLTKNEFKTRAIRAFSPSSPPGSL
ncbi:MAG: caspase family protein [Treponema sp.]|jgi:hypothetical protein|nr:caspase family protein [Treponema sp.]